MERCCFRFGAKYLSFFKRANAFNKYERRNGCYHFWTVCSTRLTYKVPGKRKYLKAFMEQSGSKGSCMSCVSCNCSCVIFRNKESFNSILSPLISPLSPISLTLFLSTFVSIYLQVLCVHFKRRAIRPSVSLIIHS